LNTVGGSEGELGDWLGPHTLPLCITGGPPGLREARIATVSGDA
jgi:hypothetical protein